MPLPAPRRRLPRGPAAAVHPAADRRGRGPARVVRRARPAVEAASAARRPTAACCHLPWASRSTPRRSAGCSWSSASASPAWTLMALVFGKDNANNPVPYVVYVWLWVGLGFLSMVFGASGGWSTRCAGCGEACSPRHASRTTSPWRPTGWATGPPRWACSPSSGSSCSRPTTPTCPPCGWPSWATCCSAWCWRSPSGAATCAPGDPFTAWSSPLRLAQPAGPSRRRPVGAAHARCTGRCRSRCGPGCWPSPP